jgi:glycosidase
MKNPAIYEINTRVWLKRFKKGRRQATLADVSGGYWDVLRELGLDYVWLMGVWRTVESTVAEFCFDAGLVEEYKEALSDWKEEDVVGSPYSIGEYTLSPTLGSERHLKKLRSRLKKAGMKLILDFVPNHFSAHSPLIKTHPELFLHGNEAYFAEDSFTFFKPPVNEELILARGRDPYFPAWTDTVQINYFNEKTQEFMIETLLNIAKLCDGVRCDMAMLVLNDVFERTWGKLVDDTGFHRPDTEFWDRAIKAVKSKYPDFIFIAESYWDTEWELQQLGFDYTYDKTLMDRLHSVEVGAISEHLTAEAPYQERSVRFLENHDEQRSIVALGKAKAQAAAVIISTIQGMRFYFDGQFEGHKVRLPVQLGREPKEVTDEEISAFYSRLLQIVSHEVFKLGEWRQERPFAAWDGDNSYHNILCWSWHYKDERRLVVVNYADTVSTCRVSFSVEEDEEELIMSDLLQDQTYIRDATEINNEGLYIQLENYQCHIFSF